MRKEGAAGEPHPQSLKASLTPKEEPMSLSTDGCWDAALNLGKTRAAMTLLEERPKMCNGAKIFSARRGGWRNELGEAVTGWLATHPTFRIVDFMISQSSDARVHCISICVFYRDLRSELGVAG